MPSLFRVGLFSNWFHCKILSLFNTALFTKQFNHFQIYLVISKCCALMRNMIIAIFLCYFLLLSYWESSIIATSLGYLVLTVLVAIQSWPYPMDFSYLQCFWGNSIIAISLGCPVLLYQRKFNHCHIPMSFSIGEFSWKLNHCHIPWWFLIAMSLRLSNHCNILWLFLIVLFLRQFNHFHIRSFSGLVVSLR